MASPLVVEVSPLPQPIQESVLNPMTPAVIIVRQAGFRRALSVIFIWYSLEKCA